VGGDPVDDVLRCGLVLDALAEGDAETSLPVPIEVDLAEGIGSAIALVSPSIERAGLHLTVEVPPTLPARADPDRLAQVLANLVANAVRYRPPGGAMATAR